MPALDHDTPALNQTTFAHCMMAAMSSYLDAIAVGDTITGRAHLTLAKQFADDAVNAGTGTDERLPAIEFKMALVSVRLA